MKIINLQLFAEEETAPAMDVQSTDEADTSANDARENTNDAPEAAADNQPGDGTPADSAPFKVFATQEEYQSYFDGIIGKRLKGARETGERLKALEPVMEMLTKRYGTSNAQELTEKIKNDIVSTNAYQSGFTEDQYRQQLDNELKMDAMSRQMQEYQHRQFMEALKGDVAAMVQEDAVLYAAADAEELATDGKFLSLLANGFSVKQAYDALHLDDVLKSSAQKTSKQVVDTIVAKGERPSEAAKMPAIAGNAVNSVSSMSDDEIEALAKRAMRGERIEL